MSLLRVSHASDDCLEQLVRVQVRLRVLPASLSVGSAYLARGHRVDSTRGDGRSGKRLPDGHRIVWC